MELAREAARKQCDWHGRLVHIYTLHRSPPAERQTVLALLRRELERIQGEETPTAEARVAQLTAELRRQRRLADKTMRCRYEGALCDDDDGPPRGVRVLTASGPQTLDGPLAWVTPPWHWGSESTPVLALPGRLPARRSAFTVGEMRARVASALVFPSHLCTPAAPCPLCARLLGPLLFLLRTGHASECPLLQRVCSVHLVVQRLGYWCAAAPSSSMVPASSSSSEASSSSEISSSDETSSSSSDETMAGSLSLFSR